MNSSAGRIPPGKIPICLALGANLGDRERNLQLAVAYLREKVTITAVSRWYETAPVGGQPGDGAYLNGALTGTTALSPDDLVLFGLEIEKRLGRVRPAAKWSARPMDIDVLFYGTEIIATEIAIIPHPRLHERQFVLEPLNEIAPLWVHPKLNQTVAELWRAWRP